MNKTELSVGDMKEEFLERRPLPMGRQEFDEWSNRILSGAMVKADEPSLKFSLAAMIMQLSPTEAFKEDAYFILALRKAAANQTAHSIMEELKIEQAKKLEKKLADEAASKFEAQLHEPVLGHKEL
jgi:hypothetical protein